MSPPLWCSTLLFSSTMAWCSFPVSSRHNDSVPAGLFHWITFDCHYYLLQFSICNHTTTQMALDAVRILSFLSQSATQSHTHIWFAFVCGVSTVCGCYLWYHLCAQRLYQVLFIIAQWLWALTSPPCLFCVWRGLWHFSPKWLLNKYDYSIYYHSLCGWVCVCVSEGQFSLTIKTSCLNNCSHSSIALQNANTHTHTLDTQQRHSCLTSCRNQSLMGWLNVES